MSIIYRSEKGGPLTAQEVDDNFRHLEKRLRALESHYPDRKIHEIRLEGDAVVIYDSAGLEMSRAQVPLIGLNPRGVWDKEAGYARNDLITYQGEPYICVRNHKPGNFNGEDWLQLFSQEVRNAESNSNN